MPLTPTATRELLTKLGHQPKRFLGQNFLVDGNIVRKSLELAEITAGDTVVEVGPGLGTLTSALLTAGAEVYAVEKDRTLHEHLATTLAVEFPKTFHLLEGDAVEFPRAGLCSAVGAALCHDSFSTPKSDPSRDKPAPTVEPTPPFKVVANLPYAISTPWMDEVLNGPLPTRLVLMLQQEAAQRYAAVPGTKSFGAISIFLQAAYDIAPGHKVPAACFHPRPDVESYLLHLVRKPAPFAFSPATKQLIRSCFQQRRKQIAALLRERLPDQGKAWLAEFAATGLGPQARPEEIPVALWMKLVVN